MNPNPYVIFALCLMSFPFFLSAAEQPNIIYLLADNMGYGDAAEASNSVITPLTPSSPLWY